MRNGGYENEQEILHAMLAEPNVPVPVPPVPVPPEVLDAGSTPEIVPWSSGEAIADDQSPAGPAVATLA